MARATGLTEGAIYWHMKPIYQKRSISRPSNLARWVPGGWAEQ